MAVQIYTAFCPMVYRRAEKARTSLHWDGGQGAEPLQVSRSVLGSDTDNFTAILATQ